VRYVALFALVLGACEQTVEPQPSESCATLRVECPNESRATEERVRASCAADVHCVELWICVARNAVCDGRGRFDEAATIALCGACGGDAGHDASVEVGEDAEPDVATDTGSDVRADTQPDARTDARVDAADTAARD